MLLDKSRMKIFGIYIGVSILSLLVLFWILNLWQSDLRIPFNYAGDTLFNGMTIKTMVDNGWYLRNSFLGMPIGTVMYDFTGSDNLHLLIIKIISLFSSDWAWVMNIFFVLTFPLTTLCSLYVFRQCGLSYPSSIAGSLLYAFLPYHFIRGEGHLFLAAYYIIPLMVMVIMWVASGEVPFSFRDSKSNILNGKLVSSIFICLLAASSGVYYAFFSCLFLLTAGFKAWCSQKRFKSLFVPAVLIFILFTGVLINLSPTIIYQYKNGKNEVSAHRFFLESEIYGLKATHLLLPINGHRISELAKKKGVYSTVTTLNNENLSSSLGVIGSIGFLILIVSLLFRGFPFLDNRMLENLSLLNIVAFLYATIGGFGVLFAMVYPQFRGLNRISVFIAFFSFFAVSITLEKWRKYCKSVLSRLLFYVVICTMIILGILDQTTESYVPAYNSMKTTYNEDAKYIRNIEALLPEKAMIFQLPNMEFPGSPGVYRVGSLDHLKGYLHSRKLRWSFGAMMGRYGDHWARWVSLKPVEDFVKTISLAGFSGIYVDRYGYPDNGAELERRLRNLLKTNPIVSYDNRRSFFDSREFAKQLTEQETSTGTSIMPGMRKLQAMPLPSETKNIYYSFDVVRQDKYFVDISGWAFIIGKSSENSKIYLVLKSAETCYIIDTNLIRRPDVTIHFKSLNVDDSGLSTIISKGEIERGTYRVGIYIKKDNIEAFQYTDNVIEN